VRDVTCDPRGNSPPTLHLPGQALSRCFIGLSRLLARGFVNPEASRELSDSAAGSEPPNSRI